MPSEIIDFAELTPGKRELSASHALRPENDSGRLLVKLLPLHPSCSCYGPREPWQSR